jgi:N-acetylglucosaminyldiphosphoundecaprenol N-acetyl-beta-D-mannosaminyltransferase
MFRLKNLNILGSKAELAALPEGKLLINTINAHSYNTARKDELFAEALTNGDVLIPDGVSIVKACRWIKAKSLPKERIAGWDLFSFEMENLERKQCGMLNVECGVNGEECRMNNSSLDNSQSASADHSCSGKRLYEPSAKLKIQNSKFRERPLTVMFMGSSQKVLDLVVKRAAEVYPHLKIVTYSPPYKPEVSEEDNKAIIEAINAVNPDLLWIGMTAPKQEKWTYSHWNELNIHCHVGTIGAVFDFFAGTVERAPIWWQRHGLEWLYRLLKEPKRMWRRYIIGNALFLWNMLKEKC